MHIYIYIYIYIERERERDIKHCPPNHPSSSRPSVPPSM